jgi:hypothetical protein
MSSKPYLPPSMVNRYANSLGVGLWIAAVFSGVLALTVHSNSPGESTAISHDAPTHPDIVLSADQFTLMMFVHPHCPCSHASMHELARIRSQHPNDVHVQVWFYCPENKPESWVHTALWDLAFQTASQEPLVDHDGRIAADLGVQTSGHALLFASDGELLFSGGITSSRGHEGDSVNAQTLGRLLRAESAEFVQYPVFGCPILLSNRSDDD